MTAFKWKRKDKLATSSATEFSQHSDDEEELEDDWLCPPSGKRACVSSLEDAAAKSKRLQSEGALLAENCRYWEAIKHWDEAIQLTPNTAVLHEMKSQVS